MNRRDFLKNSGIIAAAATLSPVMTACGNEASDLAGMKNIPDAYETDLLVVGGGPAGSCAAVAAARWESRPSSLTTETAWEAWPQKASWGLS